MAPKLRTLALTLVFAAAMSSHALAAAGGAKYEQPAKKAAPERGLSLTVEGGLGYDSNAFLTPDRSYVDYGTAGNPVVYPNKKSGAFIPVGLEAIYLMPAPNRITYIANYKFDGDFYLESDLDNANAYDHDFKLGPEISLGKPGEGGGPLFVGVRAGYHKKIYYDRDEGINKVSGTTDISDRYTYTNLGLEGTYEGDYGKAGYDVFGFFETRDYEDPVVVSQYDHDYYALGGNLHYNVAPRTKLSGGYKYSVRDYDDRRARDLNANIFASNQLLRYIYHTLDLTARQRVTEKLVGYLDYTRETRSDEFVGYNDYLLNRYRVRAIYTPTEDLRLRVAASYWTRDYDRAFAFDNPVAGAKEYDGRSLDAKAEYSYTKTLKLWAELNYDKQNTTDKRYEYDRYLTQAGASVEF